MGKVALFVTTLVTVTAIFAAPLPEPKRPRADFPRFTPPKADINVTCMLKQTCTLPCHFQGEFKEGYWRREDNTVPIVVKPPEQLYLHHDYKNIASMPEGGAALLIRGVELKHQGLHRCSVTSSTGKIDRFISLNVHAPVVDVSLELRPEELVCRSEGIYPRPNVAWASSPGPPSDPQTSINASGTGLLSVLSSVPLTLSAPHNYSCNISTEHSWRSATYRRNPDIRLSDSLTVPCVETTVPVESLVWKFNHEKTIYNRTGTNQTFGGFWTDFWDGLTESNGLALKDLTLDQRGLFSCEVSTLRHTETFIIATEVTDRKSETSALWSVADGVLLPVGISLTILFLCLTILFLCRRRLKAFCDRTKRRRSNTEEQDGRGEGEGEGAAIELNSEVQIEPEENPRQSEDSVLNTDRSDVDSFYESQSTSTPHGSLLSESSGYGQSGVDSGSIY